MLDQVDSALIDERTHRGLAIERIPDRQRFVCAQKLASNLGRNRLVHDYAPCGSATLSRRTHSAEKDRLRSHIDVGARRDDERVVAAELHDCFPQAPMNSLRNVQTHIHGAGG